MSKVLSQTLQGKRAKVLGVNHGRNVGARSGVGKLFLKGPDSKYLSFTNQEAKLRILCWWLCNYLKCNHLKM